MQQALDPAMLVGAELARARRLLRAAPEEDRNADLEAYDDEAFTTISLASSIPVV